MNTPIQRLIDFAINRDSSAISEAVAIFTEEEAWFMAARILSWLREYGKPPERRRAGWRQDAPVNPEMADFIKSVGLDHVLEVENGVLTVNSNLPASDKSQVLETVASKYRPPIWVN